MATSYAPAIRFTGVTRPADETEHSQNGDMTDAELAQYACRTTKRPLLCFAVIAASPFIAEGLCRLFRAW